MDDIKHIISQLLGEDEEDAEWKDVSPEPEADLYDAWFETYRPVKNEVGTDSAFDGFMFETYGPELEFVQAAKPEHVWTYVTGDNNEDIITAGFHYVNRMGYFITEMPWKEGNESFQFGEGDAQNADQAAEAIINNELSQNWKAEWTRFTRKRKLKFISAYLELQGLKINPSEVVALIDQWAV